jgi:hypothetical protein
MSLCVSSAAGPTLPIGWALVAAADFNGDGEPDYWFTMQARTLQRSCNMNNNVAIDVVFGPTLPPGWSLVGQ